MERLTHERVNGIKTGYWSAATKEVLDQLRIIFHRSTEEVEEAKLERLKNRLDGRNNWQGSSLHKWIEKQFSTGGDGHE